MRQKDGGRKSGRKSGKYENEIKSIMNLYDSLDKVIHFYKNYFIMMHNARCDPTHGKGFKILTLKFFFQRLPVAPAQVKVVIHLNNY